MIDDIDKIILDACCGGRMFWFEKEDKDTVFMDIRSEPNGTIKSEPNWCVKPDLLASYTDIPFNDNTFNLVVWDIPHKLKKDTGIITKKYGFLGENWENDVSLGFNEIMRVLKPKGVLCFKYNDLDIPISKMLSLFTQKPLFGTRTKKGVNNTYWFIFMKK